MSQADSDTQTRMHSGSFNSLPEPQNRTESQAAFANSVVLFNGVELNRGTLCTQLMAKAACSLLKCDHIRDWISPSVAFLLLNVHLLVDLCWRCLVVLHGITHNWPLVEKYISKYLKKKKQLAVLLDAYFQRTSISLLVAQCTASDLLGFLGRLLAPAWPPSICVSLHNYRHHIRPLMSCAPPQNKAILSIKCGDTWQGAPPVSLKSELLFHSG